MNPTVDFVHKGVAVESIRLRIPTYRLGTEDPNPPLFGKGVKAIYPYTWQKRFTETVEEKEYVGVRLRSRWTELTILPDWGMHVYRAVDRRSGRDMFFCPQVFKPAHNAMRGAYLAGGVEFNCPVGHPAMTYSPVSLKINRTADGVQVLFVNVERRSGLSLAAGVTLSDTFRGVRFDQYLFNPTPLPQAWYFWLNAGLTPHPSLRFLFPARDMIGHFEGPFLETRHRYPYPRRDGLDYSRYSKVPEPIGLFSPSALPGWFGAWYDDWNFGIARWAAPWEAAGQKFWSWGNSDEGRLWGEIAADQELAIPEIQSGRPEIQMDRAVMRPYASLAHSEYWQAADGMGTIDAASRFGALSLTEREGRAVIALSPAAAIEEATLWVNGKPCRRLSRQGIGENRTLRLRQARKDVACVDLRTADGTLLSWSRDENPPAATAITLYDQPRDVTQLGAEGLFQRGCVYARTLRPDLAGDFFRQALKQDPEFSRAHIQLGLLSLEQERFPDAQMEFGAALRIDRTSEEALYLHGLARLWSGAAAAARADLTRAAATGDAFTLPALVHLIQDKLRQGDWMACDALLASGFRASPDHPMLLVLSALLHRRRGNRREHARILTRLDERIGYGVFSICERMLAGARRDPTHLAAGPEAEDALRLAAVPFYCECGCADDALALMKTLTSREGRAHARCLARARGWKLCSNARPLPFFAWGRFWRETLETVLAKTPGDAAARFALGCLLAEAGHLETAILHLRAAVKLNPGDSVSASTLGQVLLRQGAPDAAVRVLNRAVALKPVNPLAWVLLDEACRRTKQRDARWLARFAGAPAAVKADEEAATALAALYADLGQTEEAARLLSGRVFHPYELTHHLRNLWSRIHRDAAIRQALAGRFAEAGPLIRHALAYPPSLRLGRPLRTHDAKTLFAAGCILQAAGDTGQARASFKQAADEFQPDPAPVKPYSALALMALGQRRKAKRMAADIRRSAELYLRARFQPDLGPDLEAIIRLCVKIEAGWFPTLRELLESGS
jgi:tetratricopeptide (TPR) repeat protein